MSLTAQNQAYSGGVNITSYFIGNIAAGTLTVNPGSGPLQYLNCNGAFAFTPPTLDGSTDILVINGSTAGAITFSGSWSVSANVGEAFDTVSGHQFIVSVRRINGTSTYIVKALQ
jgi:hypothetical protein